MKDLFFSFEGRINRAKYWLGNLGLILVEIVLYNIRADMMRNLGFSMAGIVISAAIRIVMIWPYVAIGVKRLHDRDKSGWWVLINLVPVIGNLWYLIQCGFLKGTEGPNKFGPDPLAEAVTWLRLAAEQGHAEAQFNLGLMYVRGEGVPQNFAEAVTWFRRAAKQGHAEAQFYLGLMYVRGEGVPEDWAEAVNWVRLAAKQGHAEAQNNLGDMYYYGQGVPWAYAEAAKWYRLAAKQGDAEAQFNLGGMYHNGEGVPRDYVQAHMWYNLAGSAGYADAVKLRDAIAATMTPDQIA